MWPLDYEPQAQIGDPWVFLLDLEVFEARILNVFRKEHLELH